MENKSDRLGLVVFSIVAIALLLVPWGMFFAEVRENRQLLKEYNLVKKQIKENNELVDKIEELIEENKKLAMSENTYISKYCAAIEFKTKECIDFIKVSTEININKNKLLELQVEDEETPKIPLGVKK